MTEAARKSAAGIVALLAAFGPATDIGACTDGRGGPGAGISETPTQTRASGACPDPPAQADVGGGRSSTTGEPLIIREVPARRPAVERTIQHDDPLVRQTLTVLGQAVNPVRVVDLAQAREMYARTPGAGAPPAGLNAFRAPGDADDPYIYLNRDSTVYRSAARKPAALALLKLAAILAHEQVHDTDGEFAAYCLQSDFVRSRLKSMPWRQREDARWYLEGLDARARATSPARRPPGATRMLKDPS